MKSLVACVFIILAFITFIVSTGKAQAPRKNTDQPKCLTCHGPYEKLAAKAPFFKGFDPQQSKITTVNPHQYWPHNDKTEKGIQDCLYCHKPHKENMRAGDKVEKANVEKCFGCHHERIFDNCNTCHEK